MTVKTKNKMWPIILLVTVVLLLGVGIQLLLAAAADARGKAQAQSTARVLAGRAAEAALERDAWETEERRQLLEDTAQILTAKKQAADEDEEILLLVNPWNAVPEDYPVVLREVGDNQVVDERCADALTEMIAACVADWNLPVIISSYRTQEMQQELYDNKVQRVIESGIPAEDAPAVAAQSVAVPGTSEHQLGLAVDIIDRNYGGLDIWQEYTSTQQWLIANSWRYGFILRYPNGTTDITGIIYEPWHYRYVGLAAAEEIHDLGLTLEEYLALRRWR